MRCGVGPYIACYPEQALLACIVQDVLWDECGIVGNFYPFLFFTLLSLGPVPLGYVGMDSFQCQYIALCVAPVDTFGRLGTNPANVGSTYWTISVA